MGVSNLISRRKTLRGVVFDFFIGNVVLERGGHHVCTAIVLSNLIGNDGKIVRFEPFPKNCEIIRKNIELNGLRFEALFFSKVLILKRKQGIE